jgi:hypothetical protein
VAKTNRKPKGKNAEELDHKPDTGSYANSDNAVLSTGWSQLPISLKAIFIIMILLTLLSLILFFLGWQNDWYFILGFAIIGPISKIIFLLLNVVAPAALLFAMWKRNPQTWKYALAYFGFFVLNNIMGMITFLLALPAGLLGYMWPAIILGAIPLVIMAIFMIIFWKERDYFDKN